MILLEELREVGHPLQHRLNARESIIQTRQMCARAGPGPILSSVGQASPDGIEANVANRRLQMCVIHNDGGEPALKQVAGPAFPGK
jgi:hypothetical protein